MHIQKKTFTKWMNSFLLKAKMEVDDLFTDLADGRKLLRLLEIISGEKLGKPNSGKMRVHRYIVQDDLVKYPSPLKSKYGKVNLG